MKTLTINNLLLRCALLSACFLLSAISTAQTTFTESSALYGLNIGDDKDGGHAWADYDLDGDLDLLINRYTSSVLLKNQLIETGSISFVDVTASLTDGMNTQRERSAIFADFNNDGYPDFARNTSFDGIEVRLQHPATHVFGDGNGGTQPYIYDDIASATAYISDGVNTEGMVAFDFDQDGDLDIAFDNHDYGIDLLINSGNGVFTHGTPKGPGYDQNDPATWPLGLAQDATDGDYSSGTDYDNDGLVDIISRKRDEVDFFRNTGGAFSTTSIDIDQADNNNKGGISFYDFDNDGDFDLFWTENGTNQIHENQNGTYVPLGSSTGIPTQFSGDTIEGLACGDIDNDGDIDIFLAGKDGYLYINQINSSAGANTGSPMQFVRDTSTNFFNGIGNGEGCTFVDIDRDGDLDLYANKSQGANELYINNLSNANSDKYLFVDIIENRDLYNLTGIEQRYAVGATARIVSCEGVVISGLREVNGGNGHGTQDPQRIHFGLPYGADQEFIVEVFFPTGPDGRKVIKYSFVPNTLGTGWERVAVFTPDMETPNGAPVAVDDTYEYPNDTDTVIINPVENDTDPESEPVQILSIEQPDHGSAVLNGDGTISFTPEPGYCGPSVMNYTAEDIASCRIFSKTDTATITLTINTTPEANDDTYVIQEDVPNNSFDVLDNDDFKCDGPQANTTITNLGAPSNGGVTLNNNGTPSNPLDDYLVYTPNPYFNGNDSFTYEITDGNGTVDTATVNVTVNPDTNKNLEILTNAISVDEGIGIATITVRITGTYQVGPTINFTTSDNSATAGADYTAVSDSHTFVGNDGELFDIEIPILDDTLIENSEIIDIQVGSTSYSTPIDLATDITITDNDGGSGNGITVSDFTVDEDAGTASFDVSLNADVQGGFAVDFAITDGSALAGSDYTAAASGTLNFVGNNTEVQSVTVTILDDTVIEGVEDLSISLSGLTTTLITILDGNATGTINDNDGGSGNGITVSDFTVDEDAGTASFDVSLNADVQGGFAVDFAVADGSALAGSDYTAAASGTLNFVGNNTEVQSVTVTILDDTVIEGIEDLSISLSGLTTTLITILDGNATGTINDNDGGSGNGITVSDFTVDEDAGTASFDVSLNADVQGGFAVDFAIADGSALAGSDYTAAASGTLNFVGNNTEVQSVTVTILDDTVIEGVEDLSIALSGLTTTLITILDGNATGTINDNDGGSGNGITVSDFTVDEDAGTATFDVSLNADVQGGFAVDFAITDGSALAGSDYTAAASGTLNFVGNNTEVQSVTVTILDDTVIEGVEDLSISLSGLTTTLITILDGNATGTINDNDGGSGNGITVSDFTVDEDAGTATFDVSLNADVQGGFAVDFAITDGSALAGSDYTAAASGTLNFVGNNTEVQSVTVTILDDTVIEGVEDLSIALSGLTTTLITILDGNATGTINDNDGGSGNGITVSDFTVDEDAGTASFDVSLNADVQGGFAVDFSITDGSALAGSDYTAAASGTLNFVGNNTEVQSVTVTILDDTVIEGVEDLSIALSGLTTTLITILDGNATGTINDNDGGSGNGITVSDFTVDEDAGTATFDVSLNADVQGGFAVDFAITDGSALAGSDYTASASGTLNFVGNNTEVQSVTVTILDDTVIEGVEDLSIALSGLTTTLITILDGNATGTINDNDGGSGNGITVSDFTVDEDAGTATFDVSLNADIQGGFAVDFAITDGSALAGSDYTAAASGTLNFVGNNTEVQSVTVTILDDTVIEGVEDLSIALSGLTTTLITILDGNATGTINDNDGGSGNGITVSDFTVDEDAGTATFDVSLNADIQGGFAVDFAITDGSALAGSDYTAAASGTLNFVGNNTEVQSVTVTILDDTVIEGVEDLSISLSGLTTTLITILDGNATGTINDNDGGSGNGITVSDFTVDEDAGTATFDVSLNADVQGGFAVDFAITDGSALAGSDYTAAASGTLNFVGNNTEVQSVTVTILDDTVIEGVEDLSISLSGLTTTLITILDGNATGTINDNDGGSGNGITVSDFTVDEDAGTATFDVSLNADVQGGFAVDFAIADGSALAGSDYTASASGTLNFVGNNTEVQSVTVTILDDTVIEGVEDLSIALSGLTTTLITILDGNATGTINDNDGGSGNGITVSDFTVDEDAGTATFDVSLNADVQGGFAVDFSITDGSALAGSDYTAAASGTLNFVGNNTEVQSVTVTILDDTVIEGVEDLSISLSGLTTTLITILDGNTTGTINDNDGGSGNGITVSDFTVDEDAGTASFDVSLNADVQGGFAVDFSITDGSALAGSDYTASASGTLNFVGNNTEVQSVTVTILDDTVIEGVEDLSISLSGLTTTLITILDGNATGTINDNDGGSGNGITVSDFTVDEDAGTATFDVSLNADIQGGFAVDFAITDGSALAGSDYTASASGTLNFVGNNTEVQSVTVTILDDTVIEGVEDLSISLSGLTTTLITILDGNATGTINDNDGGSGNGITVSDFTVDEDAGTATFDVSLNADIQGGFAVDFAIADGSALAGSDYTTTANGTLNFVGNNTEVQSVTVTILDDTVIEGVEDLSISLSGLTTTLITILDGNATGTINDNDGGSGNGITVSDFTVDEDAGTASFDVSLNADVQGGFAVDFAITDGSALSGSDYTASASGTLNFVGNNTEVQSVTVTILDDTVIEGVEDLSIALSGLTTTLITILDGNATGTINDNDGGSGNGITVSDFTVDEDAGTASFDVSLNADVQGGFAVDFAVADGSALAGSDYTASASGTLNFVGNNTEVQSVTVTILDDTVIEGVEDLSISLSGLTTTLITILDGNTTGTINDNDGGSGNGITVSDFTVDEDAGTASFDVSLNADVQGGFAVDFAIADGSALAGSDYTASASGTLNFVGNNTEVQSVTVTILDDTVIEGVEDLSISLSGLTTTLITILDGNATGTINDNDGGSGNGITVSDFTVDEDAGTATFDVSLNADIQGGFAVDFAIADGSALAGSDYTATANGTLNFVGNNTEVQSVTVTILDDTVIEGVEDLSIALSGLTTTLITILDGNATGTINDDDYDPSLGVQFDLTSLVVDEDAGTVSLDVSLNAVVQDEFTVEYHTVEGTAVSPHDYTGIPVNTQVVTFGGTNLTTQTITIPIIDDVVIESTEDFQVILTDISTTLVTILANDTATVNIIDNDGNEGWPEDITLEACDTLPIAFDITTDSACAITVDYKEDIDGQDDGCELDYTITRTWTITDCVGNVRVHTQVITILDTTAPTFVASLPQDITVSCDAIPNADLITAVDSCDPNITVILDEQITNGNGCGTAYTLTRTWTASDCAGNGIAHIQVITVQDTMAPVFVEALPQDTVVMCNEVPEASILTAMDNCDTDVAVTFEEIVSNNANCSNGYTVVRTWTTSDCAGNTNTHTQQITVQPTGPIVASPFDEEVTIMCGEELPEVPELTFMGGCGNYDVAFTEDTTFLETTSDYMIVRTWEVTDSCGNTATFEQLIFVMQYQPEEITITICVEDAAIDLRNYLPEPFDTEGTFEIQQGNAVLEATIFDPADLEVGEYLISYSAQNDTCSYFAEFYINVNSDCVPCGRDEIEVSSAVTANGDGINDMFEISGAEYCNYTYEVMLFNRWGDKVFESANYENDWGGFAPNNAFGTSGMLPAGTYYYIIKVNERPEFEPFNGYIYLGTN